MEHEPIPEEEMMTMEEAQLSTLYSEVEAWEKIIEYQIQMGRSRFRGPPGLWEKVAARLSSSTEHD